MGKFDVWIKPHFIFIDGHGKTVDKIVCRWMADSLAVNNIDIYLEKINDCILSGEGGKWSVCIDAQHNKIARFM